MIKFFRKIRYNLMSENKMSKYFKYAIGEIILVVIGILIALQINNWNQKRINNDKARYYLLGLESDLTRQIANLDNINKSYVSIIKVAENLLVDYQKFESIEAIPNINKRISNLMWENTFSVINTSFSELVSTGNISLIQNKELRNQIIEYYQYLEVSYQTTNQNSKDVFYSLAFPLFSEVLIINPSDFGMSLDKKLIYNFSEKLTKEQKNQFKNIETQKKIINAINLKILATTSNKQSLNFFIKNGKELLDNIKKELEK